MPVSIKINHCNECPSVSHSGAFTPGGSKPVCNHDDACYGRPGVKPEDWKKRQLKSNAQGDLLIPAWCPLN